MTLLNKLYSLILTILLFVPSLSYADAFCSLRDPVAQINQLFPEKTNHLSIVREINNQTRRQVQNELPQNDLHFGELGKHTLYVALKGQQTLGYVHVRSEQSSWGLIEIVWAIDTNMRIVDFTFQRCRSPQKKIIEDINYRQAFIGRNFTELKDYLAGDGISANNTLLKKALNGAELTHVILRCALKTLLLTEHVWHQDLVKLNTDLPKKSPHDKS
jgi:hypothetical protein